MSGHVHRLTDEIFRYQRLAAEELYEKERISGENARVPADLRDYFTWLCLQAGKEEAHHVIRLFEGLEALADKARDRLHSGFFFTRSQLLSLRYVITKLPGEKTSHDH